MIGFDPNCGPAYANRGLIYRQTRRPDVAMADVERAIALDANNAPAYLGRGLVYKARNQNPEALEDFNKAIALAPDNSEAYYNRGLLDQDEKRYQSAIGDFTGASGLVPQQAEPLLARAQSYLALDKPKEAATSTRRCRMSRRTREPGSREASPTSGSATRPGPAGSYGRAINQRPRDEAARTSFARVGGKPGRSYDTFRLRSCSIGTDRASIRELLAPTVPVLLVLAGQDRVEHRFGRRQHILGNRGRMRRGVGRLGAQIKPRTRRRNFRRRNRPVRIVDRDRGRIRRVRGRRVRGFGRWRRQNDRRRQRSDHGRQCDRRRGSRRFS